MHARAHTHTHTHTHTYTHTSAGVHTQTFRLAGLGDSRLPLQETQSPPSVAQTEAGSAASIAELSGNSLNQAGTSGGTKPLAAGPSSSSAADGSDSSSSTSNGGQPGTPLSRPAAARQMGLTIYARSFYGASVWSRIFLVAGTMLCHQISFRDLGQLS